MLRIENLNFSYEEKKIFENLNLKLENEKWYCLIGPNGSGKSTLIKIITGLIQSKGVFFDKVPLSKDTIFKIRQKIGVVFENNNLVCEKVSEELLFPLINIGEEESKAREKVNKMLKLFGVSNLEKREIDSLNDNEKQLVALMSALILSPKLLILDEPFLYTDNTFKKKILKVLKGLQLTVLNVTNDIEDLLVSDYVIVIDKAKIIFNDKKELLFQDEKILKQQPFIVELSQKLKYYSLVNDIKYDYKELVGVIWK